MFKRIRQLRISLAAKCQILFGAAVLLIIGAALAVPWSRMEQLTQQLNERTAAALAETAVSQHVELQLSSTGRDVTVSPTSQPVATQPSQTSVEVEALTSLPRLLGLMGPLASEPPFERRAIGHFRRHPETTVPTYEYYQLKDGSWRYRYAKPVFLEHRCIACHGQPDALAATLPAAASVGADLPPEPAYPLPVEGPTQLAGIVTVDITSRIQESQLLLNRVFILGAGLLAGTLAILSFYLITTRLILQPVRVLQETAEKVSQGDLNIRSDINTGDEFQQLSETLNTMLTNLQDSADQLRAVNKGLDVKLGQLAESNLALYESNRLKSEFLANVSHELRTPLNSILGFADLLKDAAPAGADARSTRYVNNILQSGRHLLDLINDLLDLAKIEAGKMEIRSEPLSVTDVFEGLANILKPLTEARQLSIAMNVTGDVPIIWTDPGKLQQILYNFLSNAIKFSKNSSRIDLTARREPPLLNGAAAAPDIEERIVIGVTDYGPGVAQDKQEIIFEKFRQVDASHTRIHGGTGLGLAISRELTTLLGGSIGVRSTVGQGATFWISIPLKIEAGAMDVRGKMVMT